MILLCVRWYLAYNLRLHYLDGIMAERGITVDHTTIPRWTRSFLALVAQPFNRRKGPANGMSTRPTSSSATSGCIYAPIDDVGDTVEFWFSEQRDLPAAKRFFRQVLERHGRSDASSSTGSQTNQR